MGPSCYSSSSARSGPELITYCRRRHHPWSCCTRKSSSTVLLQRGHLGSPSDSMTYMRQLGQPTSNMEVASGLLEYPRLPSWLISEETHELGGEVGDTVADLLGDSSRSRLGLGAGGDRWSFRSSLGGTLPCRLLIVPETEHNRTI